jgi:hypothetical protein
MSSGTETATRFRYGLWVPAGGRETRNGEEMSKEETMNFVRKSLGLLTAGCEQCQYSERLFCQKFKRPIKVADSRCESFARRPSAVPTDLF